MKRAAALAAAAAITCAGIATAFALASATFVDIIAHRLEEALDEP